MGAMKDFLFGFYEPLEQAFREKHGRDPGYEDDKLLWDEATKMAQEALDRERKSRKEA